MDDETYNNIIESEKDVELSREEELSYIRKIRSNDEEIAKNWTEAQMLREMEYHKRGYNLFVNFGDSLGVVNRFQMTDFEQKQTFKTYLCRGIGNCFFW